MILRDYQQKAVDDLWAFFRERKGDGNIYNPLICAPTGSGKSVIIAALIKDMIERFGGLRVLLVTHQKELIIQNHDKILSIYPKCDIGIYSASLNSRQINNKVLFCSIQSVYKRAQDLGGFSLILIDECHLISNNNNTMYQQFIFDIHSIYGNVSVVGLTATPFRLNSGYLHKGEQALFTDIAVDIPITQLLNDGYLSPVTTKQTGLIIDTKQVKKRGGEFITSELESVVDAATEQALKDAIPRLKGRKSILIFCVTIKHAEHVRSWMWQKGFITRLVTGKTKQNERDQILRDFKSNKVQVLVNVNVLTTGFDAPATDCIIMLRPTFSAGLFMQMIGRGMRTHEEKKNCLVLDYSGNIQRHGPVDCIEIKDVKKSRETGDAPVKTCPTCESILHASIRECPDCGYQFPAPPIEVDNKASTLAILSTDYEPEWRQVDDVRYSINKGKNGKFDTMRVDYLDTSGLFPITIASEFICVFHPTGYAKRKAKEWWDSRLDSKNLDDFYSDEEIFCYTDYLLKPISILIDTRSKWAKILDYDFSEIKQLTYS